MSFFASNNRIRLTNTANTTIFDTDWKQPTITSVVAGSISLPTRGNTTTVVVNHDLGPAPFNPTFVLSTARISGSTTYPWVGTTFNSSGSTLANLGWALVSGVWRLAGARTVTFLVSNNRLILREEYYNQFPSLQLASFTLSYKVYLGSFT
jgi:hypothetical protein